MRTLLNWSLAGLLVLFALFQLNDADAWLWVLLYLLPAGYIVKTQFRGRDRGIWLLAAVFFLAGLALLPGDLPAWWANEQEAEGLGMDMPFIEEAREALGLLICALFLLLSGWATKAGA